jgi:trimethylamine-N-oxide reductase (cytochrome c)
MFDASDLPTITSWRKFRQKGYAVIAAPPPTERPPVAFNWFYEGRKKDVPEPYPSPSEYNEEFLHGLQTPSGKFEFECNSLKVFDSDDLERPPILKYAAPREGPGSSNFDKFPLQLVSPHPRYSFHTQGDGKDSFINDIQDHRVLIDGHYYLVLRLNTQDAEERGIRRHDLVRIYNDRGSVICAAELTERINPGVIHGYESSAVYDRVDDSENAPERGGCLNLLTPERSQIKQAEAMAPSLCLVEVEAWIE